MEWRLSEWLETEHRILFHAHGPMSAWFSGGFVQRVAKVTRVIKETEL